jgi:hypothetical protein
MNTAIPMHDVGDTSYHCGPVLTTFVLPLGRTLQNNFLSRCRLVWTFVLRERLTKMVLKAPQNLVFASTLVNASDRLKPVCTLYKSIIPAALHYRM